MDPMNSETTEEPVSPASHNGKPVATASSVLTMLPFFPKPRTRIRKLVSLLSASAYIALFIFVPVHVATHKLLPAEADTLAWSSSDVNLDPLEPSELDFEFVKTAITTWL
ncbi:hypothetical protein BKA82DRAFT_35954 [Pisolithus tinctorius]|uniref:Uncharacterized protein n=1 Tax=Pisolithus tinctorius Marx 270 TaxID=870435 RepID=A0A0C3MXG1_PISTI|nr:hypothetical protein BKA82DRAFT_35954 [Pisolithus tinctorius]KIN93594.1 hypothetical protein M404DRAFT_35954 [Pisolithus tinctorius Marx 270]